MEARQNLLPAQGLASKVLPKAMRLAPGPGGAGGGAGSGDRAQGARGLSGATRWCPS